MAMTFTLVSHLREQLSRLVRSREERRKREEAEKERLALEVLSLVQMPCVSLTVLIRKRKLELEEPQ